LTQATELSVINPADMLIYETELFQNIKYGANKKAWMTTDTSTELLRVTDP